MSMFKKYLTAVVASLAFAGIAVAQEAPDVLIKRISLEVLDAAKNDQNVQNGNQQRILSLVEEKIIPYVNFERMTALATGRYWRGATPEQHKQLTAEFRNLLIYTYSGALAKINDQKLEFKTPRFDSDTEAEVRSQVTQSRGEPIQLNYRMEKIGNGWKIYDVNVLGAWLVETYKGTFASEISKGGIDGLIKSLAEKNKARSARGIK